MKGGPELRTFADITYECSLVEGRLGVGGEDHPASGDEVQRHRADRLETQAVQTLLVQL